MRWFVAPFKLLTKDHHSALRSISVTPKSFLSIYEPSAAKDNKSQRAYYAQKYMKIHAAHTNTSVQSEIDGIFCRMINVEQQSLAVQIFIKAPITKLGSLRC